MIPVNGSPAPPMEPIMPEPTSEAADQLAALLSPTQASTFVECGAQWYFKYLVGLPDPPTSALALGIAVHDALGESMRQKMDTGQDLPAAEVSDYCASAWTAQLDEAEVQFKAGEDPAELERLGRALVETYMAEAAPAIQPAAVELPVHGRIGDVAVRGTVDLVDVDGVVIDHKTAARKPSTILKGDHLLQLTTYTLLAPGARGQARIDTLTKTKTVALVQQSTEITPGDVKFAKGLYEAVQTSINDGVFIPRRSSWRCSREQCPFWRECEDQYGGRVA